MMQYKIPQNVGIEDRIVGPFSLRQLMIVSGGGGVSYLIFLVGSKLYELNTIEYFFIALPLLISLAFALVKVNNVSFFRFLLLLLEFNIKPRKRLWDHRSIVALVEPNLQDTKVNKEEKKLDPKAAVLKKNLNLNDLTKVLDSGGFDHVKVINHEDIDKVKDDDLITQAFFGHKKDKSPTANMYWRTTDSQKKRLDILAKLPAKKKEKTAPVQTQSATTEKVVKKTEEVTKVKIELKKVDKTKGQNPLAKSKEEVQKKIESTSSAPISSASSSEISTPPQKYTTTEKRELSSVNPINQTKEEKVQKKLETKPDSSAIEKTHPFSGEKKDNQIAQENKKQKTNFPKKEFRENISLQALKPEIKKEDKKEKNPDKNLFSTPDNFPKKSELTEKKKETKNQNFKKGELRFEDLQEGEIEIIL